MYLNNNIITAIDPRRKPNATTASQQNFRTITLHFDNIKIEILTIIFTTTTRKLQFKPQLSTNLQYTRQSFKVN